MTGSLPPAAPSPDAPDAPRRVIAERYEVVSVLGRGSSAQTLLCTDLRTDRRVVVKELHLAHLSDWKHLELFEREARTLARLDHPGIPRVHDYFRGEGEAATYHIVQELVEGPSLLQRMESGPMLGQREIREIALGLLDVLEYLHGRAPPIVHRDVKPANVLLRPDGTPALVDFGGVRAAWQPPDAAAPTVVGTFGYMAPEQFAGHAAPAADLYALGATLLHLVTGQPPSAFPFDAGRIEVPHDLPAERGMAALVEALLRPAPRDRPPDAAAARLLLTDPGSHARSYAPSHATSPGRAVASRPTPPLPAPTAPPRTRFGVSGEPRLVDMGDPPRDPDGALRDVHRNLMHPYFPARRAWSDAEHLFWLGIVGVASAATLGVAPAIYRWQLRRRRATYDDLFRLGAFTTGTILSIPASDMGLSTMVRYEFEVGGRPYVGYMQQPGEMARYWSAGDAVSVLYDPGDPGRSCIVYR